MFHRCCEVTSDTVLSFREFWKKHFKKIKILNNIWFIDKLGRKWHRRRRILPGRSYGRDVCMRDFEEFEPPLMTLHMSCKQKLIFGSPWLRKWVVRRGCGKVGGWSQWRTLHWNTARSSHRSATYVSRKSLQIHCLEVYFQKFTYRHLYVE